MNIYVEYWLFLRPFKLQGKEICAKFRRSLVKDRQKAGVDNMSSFGRQRKSSRRRLVQVFDFRGTWKAEHNEDAPRKFGKRLGGASVLGVLGPGEVKGMRTARARLKRGEAKDEHSFVEGRRISRPGKTLCSGEKGVRPPSSGGERSEGGGGRALDGGAWRLEKIYWKKTVQERNLNCGS